MAIYIQTNVASLNAQSNLAKTTLSQQTTFARLSSGYRINGASDDAAGLAISTSMNAEVRGFGVAERNANDGISMLQTADGAGSQITAILVRMRELAVQSMNGSLQSSDRTNIQTEFGSLQSEIDRISTTTTFNGINLACGSGTTVVLQIGSNTTSNDTLSVTFGKLDTSSLGITGGTNVSSSTGASSAVTAIDVALNSVSTQRAVFGASINRLHTTVANLQSMRTNLSAAVSRIRDVDVAEESAQMARLEVLQQAGSAILSQANVLPQAALSLLR